METAASPHTTADTASDAVSPEAAMRAGRAILPMEPAAERYPICLAWDVPAGARRERMTEYDDTVSTSRTGAANDHTNRRPMVRRGRGTAGPRPPEPEPPEVADFDIAMGVMRTIPTLVRSKEERSRYISNSAAADAARAYASRHALTIRHRASSLSSCPEVDSAAEDDAALRTALGE